MKKNLKFEAAIEQLETLIDQIESGEVGLEESLSRYEEGMGLVTHCRGILDKADRKIAELSVNVQTGELVGEVGGAEAGGSEADESMGGIVGGRSGGDVEPF